MTDDDHLFQPARLLRGHTSQDTAYVVDDYPYGRKLRCQIRYWLHTSVRGEKEGQVRLMSQTTNPKEGHRWNKPKAGTYTRWAVLYEDSRGHVQWWPIGNWGPSPWSHMRFRLIGLHGQLNDIERRDYEWLLKWAHRTVADEWEQAERAWPLIRDGVTRDELADTHGLYVDDLRYRVALHCILAGLDLEDRST